MGIITGLFDLIFGNGRNVMKDTIEVFRENAEAEADRSHDRYDLALSQFGGEFLQGQRGWFDQFMDGLNRLPRPLMALGCLGLFISAMVDPIWFAARMQSIALVPEPLWWLLGVIVSFYFGARHQMKGQEFQRSMAASLVQSSSLVAQSSGSTDEENRALVDWRQQST